MCNFSNLMWMGIIRKCLAKEVAVEKVLSKGHSFLPPEMGVELWTVIPGGVGHRKRN